MIPVIVIGLAMLVAIGARTGTQTKKGFSLLKVGATTRPTVYRDIHNLQGGTQGGQQGQFYQGPNGEWLRVPANQNQFGPATPSLDQFTQMYQAGFPVPPQLYAAAIQDALRVGDYPTAQFIQQLAAQGSESVVMGADDDGGDAEKAQARFEAGVAEDGGEYEDVTARPKRQTESQHKAAPVEKMPTSPIEGVDPGEWSAFAEALHTKDPGFKTERHVGAYEHHRQRLRALGIPDSQLATEDGQYQALCADVTDYTTRCGDLIRNFTGDQVVIDGKPHPVTMSGVLGVLKAAGPQGAAQWLANPDDRTKFPRTTDTFLRTNNCF